MIDSFGNNNIHFLEITINKIKADVYYKATHNGQYSGINNNVPWNYKTSWIKYFYH